MTIEKQNTDFMNRDSACFLEPVEVPDISIYEMIHAVAQKQPRAIAINYMSKRISYQKFLDQIDLCAGAFRREGVSAGDIVTVCLANTPEVVITVYALSKIGAVANLIHPMSAENEMIAFIRSADSRLLIAMDAFAEKLLKILPQTNIRKTVLVSPANAMPLPMKVGYALRDKTPKPQYTAEIVSWKQFCTAGKAEPSRAPEHFGGQHPVAIMHSGGTTGTPKEILLCNSNLNALACQSKVVLWDIAAGDSVLAVLPVFHAFGLGTCIHMTLCMGACAVLVPRFMPDKFASFVEKNRITLLFGVPTLYEALMKSASETKPDLSCVKYAVSGGDFLTEASEKRINAFLQSHGSTAKIAQGYGLTESCGATCIALKGGYMPGSIGKPLPGNEFCIVEPGSQNELPAGEEGEICISGPTIMQRYRNNEEETNGALQKHKDGKIWLHTGDIGCCDKDGFYFYRLRMKRLIVSSGFNVYPQQIEKLIETHPAVEKCVAVGIPHPYKIEVVKAVIVLKDGYYADDALQAELKALCAKNLAKYSTPYQYVFRDSIPQTIIGKIDFERLKKEDNG